MTEYIEQEAAIATKLTTLEAIDPSITTIDTKANMLGTKEAVSLYDIYKLIAGYSYYYGDSILAALTCIVEGKEVNPVRPADVAPVVHEMWTDGKENCPICGKSKFKGLDADIWADWKPKFCPNCGAKMDNGDEDDV